MGKYEPKGLSRESSLRTLRFFLARVRKADLVSIVSNFLSKMHETDGEFETSVHDIVTLIQARDIVMGEASIEDFSEEHQPHLRKIVMELKQATENN